MNYAGDRKRALSKREAQNCEDANEPVCRCRCKGLHHGGLRGDVSLLPMDDPHSPSKICPKCDGSGQETYVDAYSYEKVTFKCTTCQGAGRVLPKKK